ncbi:MAG: glycosyltransferase family 2 protein [Gammaproteobacteria bacterium]
MNSDALDSPDYSVVIPCYNEGDNIEHLVREVVAAAEPGDRFEIVVVDDASTDHTLDALRQLKSRQPALRIVRHAVNRGQSAALCTGVAAARGGWIATLDGDGQNDPADVPALLAEARRLAMPDEDLVVCGHRTRRQDTFVRRLSSRIANGVRARALGDATPDTGCGLKVFRRDTFMRLPHFNHMHRFLPALVQRAGGRSVSVPVNHRPRLHGFSKYGIGNRLWVGIVDLFGVSWLIRRRFRLSRVEEI